MADKEFDELLGAGETTGGEPPQPAAKPAENVDWKAKYDGLRGYALQLKGELDRIKAQYGELATKYEGAMSMLEAAKLEATTKVSDLERMLNETKAQAETAAQKAARLERERQVAQLIASEYADAPELMRLFNRGLIDIGNRNDDEVRQVLDQYKQELTQLRGGAIKEALTGAVPNLSAKKGADGPTIQELANKLMRPNLDEKERDELTRQYLDLLRSQMQGPAL